MERLAAIESLRRTGKYTGGGGFEAVVVGSDARAREEWEQADGQED